MLEANPFELRRRTVGRLCVLVAAGFELTHCSRGQVLVELQLQERRENRQSALCEMHCGGVKRHSRTHNLQRRFIVSIRS